MMHKWIIFSVGGGGGGGRGAQQVSKVWCISELFFSVGRGGVNFFYKESKSYKLKKQNKKNLAGGRGGGGVWLG